MAMAMDNNSSSNTSGLFLGASQAEYLALLAQHQQQQQSDLFGMESTGIVDDAASFGFEYASTSEHDAAMNADLPQLQQLQQQDFHSQPDMLFSPHMQPVAFDALSMPVMPGKFDDQFLMEALHEPLTSPHTAQQVQDAKVTFDSRGLWPPVVVAEKEQFQFRIRVCPEWVAWQSLSDTHFIVAQLRSNDRELQPFWSARADENGWVEFTHVSVPNQNVARCLWNFFFYRSSLVEPIEYTPPKLPELRNPYHINPPAIKVFASRLRAESRSSPKGEAFAFPQSGPAFGAFVSSTQMNAGLRGAAMPSMMAEPRWVRLVARPDADTQFKLCRHAEQRDLHEKPHLLAFGWHGTATCSPIHQRNGQVLFWDETHVDVVAPIWNKAERVHVTPEYTLGSVTSVPRVGFDFTFYEPIVNVNDELGLVLLEDFRSRTGTGRDSFGDSRGFGFGSSGGSQDYGQSMNFGGYGSGGGFGGMMYQTAGTTTTTATPAAAAAAAAAAPSSDAGPSGKSIALDAVESKDSKTDEPVDRNAQVTAGDYERDRGHAGGASRGDASRGNNDAGNHSNPNSFNDNTRDGSSNRNNGSTNNNSSGNNSSNNNNSGNNNNNNRPDRSRPINPNACDSTGFAPLHYAASLGRDDDCRLLVTTFGANPNVIDRNGFTPLHWAVMNNRGSTVRVLIEELHAALSIVDKRCMNPFYLAVENGNVELANYLACVASTLPEAEAAMVLNSPGIDGNAPLLKAAMNGYREMLTYFVSLANVDVSVTDDKQQNVVHLTCILQRTDCLDVLLEDDRTRSLVNMGDAMGTTPLHWASHLGNLTILTRLFSAGAQLDVVDASGHWALEVCHDAQVAQWLREHAPVGLPIPDDSSRYNSSGYDSWDEEDEDEDDEDADDVELGGHPQQQQQQQQQQLQQLQHQVAVAPLADGNAPSLTHQLAPAHRQTAAQLVADHPREQLDRTSATAAHSDPTAGDVFAAIQLSPSEIKKRSEALNEKLELASRPQSLLSTILQQKDPRMFINTTSMVVAAPMLIDSEMPEDAVRALTTPAASHSRAAAAAAVPPVIIFPPQLADKPLNPSVARSALFDVLAENSSIALVVGGRIGSGKSCLLNNVAGINWTKEGTSGLATTRGSQVLTLRQGTKKIHMLDTEGIDFTAASGLGARRSEVWHMLSGLLSDRELPNPVMWYCVSPTDVLDEHEKRLIHSYRIIMPVLFVVTRGGSDEALAKRSQLLQAQDYRQADVVMVNSRARPATLPLSSAASPQSSSASTPMSPATPRSPHSQRAGGASSTASQSPGSRTSGQGFLASPFVPNTLVTLSSSPQDASPSLASRTIPESGLEDLAEATVLALTGPTLSRTFAQSELGIFQRALGIVAGAAAVTAANVVATSPAHEVQDTMSVFSAQASMMLAIARVFLVPSANEAAIADARSMLSTLLGGAWSPNIPTSAIDVARKIPGLEGAAGPMPVRSSFTMTAALGIAVIMSVRASIHAGLPTRFDKDLAASTAGVFFPLVRMGADKLASLLSKAAANPGQVEKDLQNLSF
ncbi:hypothetical protein CAOG_02740 [Capsaspora owczarzaki ATCC 30864]|uniref:Uncharacterized protein n=1 Tax=Capsaspora owczarzaki (strain ATCC 30864) TaxID=595528 RepID=A0A0D2VN36_CAPO3|nr:hypothetical protein CAOG_02740 [Capsaspora owczarzaki ATCC 30864]KJE91627.1 hypothetical protein CAOG_002740 [Capsaspora owczarzaki ATCC 30864]|eukprot:XP_004349490.1 hypothetical protein CAOG_02740 [Capsaspora owczarzaki ATCC 30864]